MFIVILHDDNKKLKETDIKNLTYHYLDDLINADEIVFGNILLNKKTF